MLIGVGKYLFVGVTFCLFSIIMNSQNIRVACIGDSVTFGSKIKERDQNSYPSQLQTLLGENYEVRNFGHSGATALKKGHKPYYIKPEYKKSLSFNPNIVIIHLGLNDQGLNNWPEHKDEFVNDYIDLIESYLALPSHPKVMICKMTPTFSGHHWFEEGMRENYSEIQSKIEFISKNTGVDLIDLHEQLYRFPEFFPDNLHPLKEGATIIASKIYSSLTGDYGGLKLPPLYGEKMVIQQKEPIIFYGSSNAFDKISVEFNNLIRNAHVDKSGKWKITFPEMEAGGPYELIIDSKISDTFKANEVYIGEVWLASGQSNMDFKVKNMNSGLEVINDSLNSNIFLFSMDGKAQTASRVFSEEELNNCNSNNYFNYSGWSNENNDILENFSAVAYSYAYNLQKQLNVPVGIICNAVGGSTTQSWISREHMESTHVTVDLLNDTHLNPLVQPWVSQRREKNFKKQRELNILARHPFDPTMLFDAGINPIKNYNIKGVIWYQGESNAEKAELHSMLFKLLVKDWRMHWGKEELPFYFVQLSSIKRDNWGVFRDSQRKLLSIPNTGMAVSLDIGHPTNVHPVEKWIIGDRLAKIARFKNYSEDLVYSGPLFDFLNVNNNMLRIHFQFSEGLRTKNDKNVEDIFIAGSDKMFVKAQARIVDNILQVWSASIKQPRYVKYGFTPFSNGNLINKQGLPASTFTNLIDY